jgi:hypothetical protein
MTIIYMDIHAIEDLEARSNLSDTFCGSWIYLKKLSARVRFVPLLGRAERKNLKKNQLLDQSKKRL